jgi:hypothetical protein
MVVCYFGADCHGVVFISNIMWLFFFRPGALCRKVDCGRIINIKSTEVKKKSTVVVFLIKPQQNINLSCINKSNVSTPPLFAAPHCQVAPLKLLLSGLTCIVDELMAPRPSGRSPQEKI